MVDQLSSPLGPQKTFYEKLARLQADAACTDFILADAKDPDMAFGISAPGRRTNAAANAPPFRSLADMRQMIREIVRLNLVDIMLMSASTNEQLTLDERIFDSSSVTPAVRANDTTDIWCGNSGSYPKEPSLPFRTTTIDHIQSGRLNCTEAERPRGAGLGLYSLTFNNCAQRDREALEAYRAFRHEAEMKGFQHFLEVFAPNDLRNRAVADIGAYVNDCITRTLAGVTRAGRPLFLKIPYFGPQAMEALVNYDPSLIVGVLGGAAGTTFDAFQLLSEARKYGARAALFGRKINNAEDQILFLQHLRQLAEGTIEPSEAVRRYHSELIRSGITPHRPLEDDLQKTT